MTQDALESKREQLEDLEKSEREARERASEMKLIQRLGPESVAAVAKARGVKESKLKMRQFEKQVQDNLRVASV